MTKMLSMAQATDQVNVVADQIGRPTFAGDLANACLAVASSSSNRGIYHVSGTGSAISWADFAEAIFSHTSKPTSVNRISTSSLNLKASRPPYSVLDNSSFEDEFHFAMPGWKDGLQSALSEITQTEDQNPT